MIQKATGISVSPTSATLYIGRTLDITATVTPTTTSNKTVTWSSSNTAIATVDNNGKVTPKAAGTVTITATTTDGSNLSDSCLVTINSNPIIQTVTLESKDINSLTINAKGIDADEDKLTYELYVSTSQTGGFTKKATSIPTNSGIEVSLTANGLSEYTEYYYYVTVSDGKGTPVQSNIQGPVRTYCPGNGYTCEGGYDYHECPFCSSGIDYRYDEDAFVDDECPDCGYTLVRPRAVCHDKNNCGKEFNRIYKCNNCEYRTHLIRCKHGFNSPHEHCIHGYSFEHDTER